MNAPFRCLCGPPPGHAIRMQATDADARLDPTGTSRVRAAFERDMNRRWLNVKTLLVKSIKDRFTNSGLNVSHAALTGQSPVVAFQSHVDEALRQIVLGYNGSWTMRYVREGAQVGAQRAAKLAPSGGPAPDDRVPTLQQLVISELRGICEAASQQIVRAYGNGLLRSQSAGATAQAVGAVVEKVGRQRGRVLVQFSVVRAHAMATLDGFRASGVTHVGTVAERTRIARRDLVRDAKKKSPLHKFKGLERVEVLTAGDDDVCPVCEEISDEGPYDLDEAESLIPAHPNCRCSFVPADDARFASVHDSVTHIAAGVMILDPQGRALFVRRSSTGDHAGEWAFPGGAVEPGETVEGAAIRETFEEIGFRPDSIEQIDRRERDGVDFTTYVAHVPEQFEPTLNREHTDWRWCALSACPEPLHPGAAATVRHALLTEDDFNPAEPRDPQGKWTSGGGSLNMNDLTKVSGPKGSNPGGVYVPKVNHEVGIGKQYYVKEGKSANHVTNELLAAKLYQLAGAHTLNYVPVEGGMHVATEYSALGKSNVKDLTSVERLEAQHDLAVHAWLANWDAVGTGGDNVGITGGPSLLQGGKVTTLDVGGSLKYRAQGGPKGAAFGDTVPEINSLRDMSKNPDAAKLFGSMTNDQIRASIKRVTELPNSTITKVVLQNGGTQELADKLIARKQDLDNQFYKLKSETLASDPTPQPAPTPATDLIHSHVPHVKGTSAERVAMRKQLQSITDPELKKQMRARVLASFLKQHNATAAGEKKSDLAKKLASYSQQYKMPNPLMTAPLAAAPSSFAAAKIKPAAPAYKPPPPAPVSLKYPSSYASFSQSEKDGFQDIVNLVQSQNGGTNLKYAHDAAATYVDVGGARLKYLEGHKGLTPVDAAHIVAYSGSQYRATNSALRAGTMTEELYHHVNALDAALQKLPSYASDTVWRKADLSSPVAAKYVPGNVVTEWGFTSTSKKQGVWSGDFRFEIKTRPGGRAHDIQQLSSHGDSEAEVLYESGVRFKVLKREGNKITMQELK